jgi:hypothetical protein
MTKSSRPIWAGALLSAVSALALAGCGTSSLTSTRIERALETTFVNLVELQVLRMGLRPMTAPDFAVTAICHRQADTHDTGSGEWSCTLVWQGPDRRTLRDTYDLFVATDGCFSATAADDNLGGPTLKTPEGRLVKNYLYAFDGCFDPT